MRKVKRRSVNGKMVKYLHSNHDFVDNNNEY